MKTESSGRLQTNIVKGHGRKYAIYIPFYTYKGEDVIYDRKASILSWLRYMGEEVTTQAEQSDNSFKKKQSPDDYEDPCVVWLAISNDVIELFNFPSSERTIDDRIFKSGMVNRYRPFHDYLEHRHEIEDFYQGTQGSFGIHGVICIAGDNVDKVLIKADELQADTLFRKAVVDSKREYAYKGIDPAIEGANLDPLGYADGLSQVQDSRQEKNNDFVLIEDAFDPDMRPSFGSYLVYRKIEVDRTFFQELIEETASAMGVSDEQAKALYMGRFPNGTSLMLEQSPTVYDYKSDIGNKFDYSKDPKGDLCPLRAHVRVVNPRNKPEDVKILRRSMLYVDDLKKLDSREALKSDGMLFLSYQNSIDNDFMPILFRMSNEGDSLFYRNMGELDTADFPNPFNQGVGLKTVRTGGRHLTKFKGGECLYVPSPDFLKNLSLDEAS